MEAFRSTNRATSVASSTGESEYGKVTNIGKDWIDAIQIDGNLNKTNRIYCKLPKRNLIVSKGDYIRLKGYPSGDTTIDAVIQPAQVWNAHSDLFNPESSKAKKDTVVKQGEGFSNLARLFELADLENAQRAQTPLPERFEREKTKFKNKARSKDS